MAKSRNKVSNPTTAVESPSSTPARSWPFWLRLIVSLLLLFHITAQVIYSWAATDPLSPLGRTLRDPFEPYIVAANLNNGYRFFAPDPGRSSNILRYELFDEHDKPIAVNDAGDLTAQIPPVDLRAGLFNMRPRLLYHRYFMLTEQVPIVPPPNAEIPPQEMEAIKEAFRTRMYSYAQEIMRAHNASKIHLHFLHHRIMPPDIAYQNPDRPLDHPESYVENWDEFFQRNKMLTQEEIAPAK